MKEVCPARLFLWGHRRSHRAAADSQLWLVVLALGSRQDLQVSDPMHGANQQEHLLVRNPYFQEMVHYGEFLVHEHNPVCSHL